jgi:predicted transposase YbfD/YdcC
MNSICLGQIACGKKTNEITTIPIILDLLDIKGSIITIDAMGSQREIVKKIVENEADYILAVKGNQGCLEEEVHTTCRQNSPISDTTIVDKGHGRIETRRCQVYEKGLIIDFENRRKGLDTVIKITLTRESPSTSETKERFYISSLKSDKDFNKFILREDEQRKRVLHVDKNFAIVRKIALNLLKKDQRKGSLRTKRLKAAWNKDFLIDLLKY